MFESLEEPKQIRCKADKFMKDIEKGLERHFSEGSCFSIMWCPDFHWYSHYSFVL